MTLAPATRIRAYATWLDSDGCSYRLPLAGDFTILDVISHIDQFNIPCDPYTIVIQKA